MNNRIQEILDDLETYMTPEMFKEHKEQLLRIGVMINAEEFFAKHPVEIASGHQSKRPS
jgi:hypothetical protein